MKDVEEIKMQGRKGSVVVSFEEDGYEHVMVTNYLHLWRPVNGKELAELVRD